MTLNRLIGSAPNQVSVNGMLGNLAFQNAESVSLGSVSVQQLLGQILSALGTAAAPTYTFTGDINTGIYNPDADQLAISTGGTEQWRINSGGIVLYNQPTPAAVDATATLTVANLTSKIITSTTAAAVTMTLPTGTLMDGGFTSLYNNMAFEWTVINTGATNAVTVQGGTGHTLIGSGTVAASGSGRFVSRRTGTTTWVTYRLAT